MRLCLGVPPRTPVRPLLLPLAFVLIAALAPRPARAQAAPGDSVAAGARRDTLAAGAAADSSAVHPIPVPPRAPAPRDSVGPAPAPPDSALGHIPAPLDTSAIRLRARGRGVADTVTVLPPVRVEDQRGDLTQRTTATTVHLDRAGVVRFLPSTVGDALAAVPGVDQAKLGPWAARLSMRGLSGDRVLVLVDGVRLNGVRGHGGQPSLISVDRLDAVELLPGASSAQFGSDALGGVINLVTHRDLMGDRLNLDGSVIARANAPGDGNAQQLRARLRAPGWGLEAAGGLGALDALVTPRGSLPNSGFKEDNWSARGAARLGPVALDIEHARQAAHDVGLPAFNQDLGFNGAAFTGLYPLQSRDADRLELAMAARGPRPEARLLGVIQTQRNFFTETTTDSTFRLGRLFGTTNTDAADRVTTRSASVQPLVRFPGAAGLRLSGEYRHETAGGPRVNDETYVRYDVAGNPTSTTYGHSAGESEPRAWRDTWSGGAFLRPQSGPFGFETGMRYDWARSHADSTVGSPGSVYDTEDRRWTGEMGFSYAYRAIEPYLHLSTGFRVPNLDECFYNDDIHGGLRLFGNPDLVPERSESYEVGVRATEGAAPWLTDLRVSAYRSNVRDLISFRYVTTVNLVPRFQYFNLQQARIDGLELQTRLKLGAAVAALNAGFPRGVDTQTGERILDVGTSRVTADLMLPLTRVMPLGQLALRARWNDAVPEQFQQRQLLARPASWVASAEASTVVGGVRAVLSVRNLFDTYYFEPLTFIPEPGRTFALALRRDFDLPLGAGRKVP